MNYTNPTVHRTLGTALTTLLLILLSIVLSSATSLISTIQTTQVPAASADSRANWALTNAGEWSAYVSTYYYVIDAPVRVESDGGGSGKGSGGGGGESRYVLVHEDDDRGWLWMELLAVNGANQQNEPPASAGGRRAFSVQGATLSLLLLRDAA